MMKFEIVKKIGTEFSLLESIKMNGIGSPRVISLNSEKELSKNTTINDNRLFSNFKLYKKGILIIQGEKLIGVEKHNLLKIEFIERPIKIRVKQGIKIVHDAKIEIFTSEGKSYIFYSTRQSFKSLRKFFEKNWFENLVEFKVHNEIVVDNNHLIIDMLDILIRGF